MGKRRECFGEYEKLSDFCRHNCPDRHGCLKLKERVLLSCLPVAQEAKSLAHEILIETNGEEKHEK